MHLPLFYVNQMKKYVNYELAPNFIPCDSDCRKILMSFRIGRLF